MEAIIRILVEDILTFAYCDEDQIAEDFSVAQLERIAQSIISSGPAAIALFLGVIDSMASEARAVGSEERAAQLESMPSHLGLA